MQFYRQLDSMDCGPTCLRMIARYYGKSIPITELREMCQIGKEGVNLYGIGEAAETLGFRTQSIKVKRNILFNNAKLPVVLHWNQNHFVVLYKVKKNKIYIADPAKGLIQLNINDFNRNWILDNESEEGIALIIEPTPFFYQNDFKNNESRDVTSEHLLKYIYPYRNLILQLFVGLLFAGLFQLILPFLAVSIVDTGISTSNISFINMILIAQLALFAGRIFIEFIRGWILLHISTRINVALLTDFLIKLMKLPISYFDTKQTGDILQRMNDHKRIEYFITGSSLTTIFSIFNIIIFSFVLIAFSLNIFLVFIISSLIYFLWVYLFLKRKRQLDQRKFEYSAKEQGLKIQLVQGMQEIKLNGAEKIMRWRWESLQAKLFKYNVKTLSINQWQQAGAFFINEGKNIIITFISANSVITGQMSLGTMIAIQYILGQLNSPIDQMIGFIQNWQNAKMSLERLNEVHNLKSEEDISLRNIHDLPIDFTKKLQGGKKLQNEDKLQDYNNENVNSDKIANIRTIKEPLTTIDFINVSFKYPGAGNEFVLHNLNFSIPIGKTTAIVGGSGSGKTTILKLLLKYYSVQEGEIKFGKINLENISHNKLRKQCGVVMQDSYIFSDTIANNVAVGQEHIDYDKLSYSLVAANANEFINTLPLGIRTKIGAEGVGLSMGQKQRILIARAVYRNPAIILFDEATNSLDANNETVILNNLLEFFKERTVLVVAHRLSTVKSADKIVVLNKGVISESGTHIELMKRKGEYYTLIKNQLERR